MGYQGTRGYQGPQGNQGATGIQGITGAKGIVGPKGDRQGIQGITGTQGTMGYQGTRGYQGPQGNQGATGIQGITGAKGDTGGTGYQGTQGITGAPGYVGYQGTAGNVGSNASLTYVPWVSANNSGILPDVKWSSWNPNRNNSGVVDVPTELQYYVRNTKIYIHHQTGDFDGTDNTSYNLCGWIGFKDFASKAFNYAKQYDSVPTAINATNATNATQVSITSNGGKRFLVGITGTGGGNNNPLFVGTSSNAPYMMSGSLYSPSDARIKDNIEDISLEEVDKLFETYNGYIQKFNWKGTDNGQYGFIAQNLMEYSPESVDYNNDIDRYSVSYTNALSKICAAMFKKIKELEKRVKALENS